MIFQRFYGLKEGHARHPVIRAAAFVPAVLLATACVFRSTPPVPVRGGDVQSLAGKWAGEYSSAETGRRGSIVFALVAGRDTASGHVVMRPQPLDAAAAGDKNVLAQPIGGAQLLTIRFVRVSGDRVSGMLDPYTDPDCGCTVVTTFVGTHHGDVIEGTFRTGTSAEATAIAGRWRVTRLIGGN